MSQPRTSRQRLPPSAMRTAISDACGGAIGGSHVHAGQRAPAAHSERRAADREHRSSIPQTTRRPSGRVPPVPTAVHARAARAPQSAPPRLTPSFSRATVSASALFPAEPPAPQQCAHTGWGIKDRRRLRDRIGN
jgi:hypothetical protein